MRFQPIPPDEMNAEQRAIYDEALASKRGQVPAPVLAWLHSPDLARHAARLGAFLRFDTTLGAQLSELAILVTARHWSAAYEWYAHKKLALQAGIAPDVLDAINIRHVPDLDDPRAQIVYEVSEALHESRVLPQALYNRARTLLGERGLVELIGLLGYYTLVSMTLNAYEVGLPEGEVSDLAP
jgi:4-carboxymuconolactone decarboxylase